MEIQSFTASYDLLQILLKFARESGIDEQTIISESDFNLSEYKEDELRIPMDQYHKIWVYLIEKSSDSDWGLHFGEYCSGFLNRHLLFSMMGSCKNLREAIRKNFQYHNLIIDIITPQIIEGENNVSITWKINHPFAKADRHFSESVMALQTIIFKLLSESKFSPSEVRFIHDKPYNISEHNRIFKAPLIFNSNLNELIYDKKNLGSKILLANQGILKGLEQLVRDQLNLIYRKDSYTEKVSSILSERILADKNTDIETVAGELGMGGRTLQLKLSKEENSFRQIFDEVRKGFALNTLKDKNSTICETALMLKFSDQSAFHNAFKRWTGKTPGQYRKE